jgi:predicted hotdog family 3-hydroxylacyl-ACP dehydratase
MQPEIADLIPHQGAMCLNERVVAWDEASIRLATRTHENDANPLRRDGRLQALHLGEYGAQAMAVHGGLLAARDGRRALPGLLVSLRGVKLHREFIDDCHGELVVEAARLMATEDSWQYEFRVLWRDELLAEGRAAVMMRRDEAGE